MAAHKNETETETETEKCGCINCANGVKPTNNPSTHCFFCECLICIPGA